MKTRFALLAAAALLVLLLSACVRPASTPPTGLITATAELPFEFETGGSQINEIISLTQTAQATVTTDAKSPTEAAPAGETQPPTAPTSSDTPAPSVEPTQAPPPAEWNPTPGVPASYTLNKGEHVYCLARRFNVHPGDLLSANGLNANSVLNPGTSLKIPQNSAWPTDSARSLMNHPTSYTVKAGDTVYTVACAFGDADPNGIIAANSLQTPYELTAGQTLQIP
ncbi:MAG TPA: LysM peptidoglycan-binding domain-containing protein [Anaerolineaceae bacterium]|nr:LysM peptidoglycan-binding domain-containing protein [Anaerolineaceae bacterium]